MNLLTQQTIETELQRLWDNVMAIHDEQLKQFASTRISAKEKELRTQLQAQKSLLKYLDKFALEQLEQLEELMDADVKRVMIAKFGKNREAVNTILFVFTTIVKLLKESV